MEKKTNSMWGRKAIWCSAGGAMVFLLLFIAAPRGYAEGSGEHVRPRTISVSGTGSVTASPDLAVVRLGVETRNNNAGRAIDEAAARSRAITAAVEHDGVAATDITTVEYNIGFVATSEGRPAGVPSGSAGPGSGRRGYYSVTDVASVTLRDIGRLGKVLDDALSAGANEVQGVSFRIADPTPLESRARALAFRDAHAKAAQIAALAGEKLGPVLRVTTSGSPVPRPGGTFRALAVAAPSISPGSLEVSVTLQLVYEIGGK